MVGNTGYPAWRLRLCALVRSAWWKWWTIVEYAKCFGAVRGFFYFLRSHSGLCRDEKRVRVSIPDAAKDVLVRLGTTDIFALNSIFRHQEYGWDFTKPPAVIVDGGAYTGLSTVYFALRYPDAQVIAVEPGSSNFELLVENTASLANVYAVHAALWARSGQLTLIDPGIGAWGLRVAEEEGLHCPDGQMYPEVPGARVRGITVADLMQMYRVDRIGLLKLDIEGSEKEVLSDCASWIDRVDAICAELHDEFKPGCTKAFFRAADEFTVDLRGRETIMAARVMLPKRVDSNLSDGPDPPCRPSRKRWLRAAFGGYEK